ncbi:MAG: hypothetical protein HOV81_12470 [Kofleriaceae bacterium]|nr:hypothetical protein [Kofleriaceae bacterium]
MRALVLTVLALAGCTEPDYDVVVGRIQLWDEPVMIEVPSSARRGELAIVNVTTSGNECVDYLSTDLDVHGDVADVTPLDRHPRGNLVCHDIWKSIRHEVGIAFDTAGVKTIVVHGRRTTANFGDEVIEVPFTITVE